MAAHRIAGFEMDSVVVFCVAFHMVIVVGVVLCIVQPSFRFELEDNPHFQEK